VMVLSILVGIIISLGLAFILDLIYARTKKVSL
jgi:hypothetical protein